jgi:hypothetical protein
MLKHKYKKRVKVNHKIPHGDGRVKIGKHIYKRFSFLNENFLFFFSFLEDSEKSNSARIEGKLKTVRN